MSSQTRWDQYFITIASVVAMNSKDPSTRVGAVIVGPDREIRSTGYNGFPRGLEDSEKRYQDRITKYAIINHAEENAILHCARIGVAAKSCTLYTTWLPCVNCAKLIIQSGIAEVIYHGHFPGNHKESQLNWADSLTMSFGILTEAGLHIRSFDGPLLAITGLYKGIKFTPEIE